MAWVRRGRKSVYYQNRRVGGRVERLYLGDGPEAQLAAALAAQRRLARQLWRRDKDRWREASLALAMLCQAADLLARAELLAAGYRQHQRGEWRRRRA
jgi:hypothetical protein